MPSKKTVNISNKSSGPVVVVAPKPTTPAPKPKPAPTEQSPDLEIEGKKIKLDVVVGYMMNKTKKTFNEEFQHVFDKLLERIAEDYEIPVDELQDNYQLECQFHNRKPRDPTQACQAKCKNGNPCTKTKKDGYDYCGIHLNMSLKNKTPTPLKKVSKKGAKVGDDEVGEDEVGDDEVGEDEVGEDEVGEDEVGEDEPTDDNVEMEEFQYQGETYLRLGEVLYEYPDELDEDTELADLEIVGKINLEEGTVEFRGK